MYRSQTDTPHVTWLIHFFFPDKQTRSEITEAWYQYNLFVCELSDKTPWAISWGSWMEHTQPYDLLRNLYIRDSWFSSLEFFSFQGEDDLEVDLSFLSMFQPHTNIVLFLNEPSTLKSHEFRVALNAFANGTHGSDGDVGCRLQVVNQLVAKGHNVTLDFYKEKHEAEKNELVAYKDWLLKVKNMVRCRLILH
jgi:hypothetical protein